MKWFLGLLLACLVSHDSRWRAHAQNSHSSYTDGESVAQSNFLNDIEVYLPGAMFTPLQKNDIVALHTSAYRSSEKYPGIPVAQSSPPGCPSYLNLWYKRDVGMRVRTNSDRSAFFSAFRRGTNDTLGDKILGMNYQVSSMFFRVAEDQQDLEACELVLPANGTQWCQEVRLLHEKKYRHVWYLDGVPSLYLHDFSEAQYAVGVEQPPVVSTVDLEGDYEVGVPVVPRKQYPNANAILLWTKFELVIYYRTFKREDQPLDERQWFEVVGLEVHPRALQQAECESDVPQHVSVRYSTKWVETNRSWNSRAVLYKHKQNIKREVDIFTILFSFLALGLITLASYTALTLQIRQEREQAREKSSGSEPVVVPMKGWEALKNDVFRTPSFKLPWCMINGMGAHALVSILAVLLVSILLANAAESTASVVEGAVWIFSLSAFCNGLVGLYCYRVLHYGEIPFTVSKKAWVNKLSKTCFVSDELWAACRVTRWTSAAIIALLALVWLPCQWILKNENSTAYFGWSDTLIFFMPFVLLMLASLWGGALVAYNFLTTVPFDKSKVSPVERSCDNSKRYFNYKTSMALALSAVSCTPLMIFIFNAGDLIWSTRIYTVYWTIGIAGSLTLFMTCVAALVYLKFQLRWEDWRWWWSAPSISALVGCFGFLISMGYSVTVMQMTARSALLLFSIKMAAAFFLLSCIFFSLASLCCVVVLCYLYSYSKQD